MHVFNARLTAGRLSAVRAAGFACGLALLLVLFGVRGLQNAVAEGETRTITMHHIHTGEDISITYKVNGRYDPAALKKLDWFLRDWRRNETTSMDPRLIDLVWEVQREAGNDAAVQVVCGYRSPQTNAMLRRRSEGVARFSQHVLGRAMDFFVPGVPLEKLREIGLRLERGGVGFYPESGSPFVHMDVAGIRMWPRMTREQLARVFPDGRTVQIPTDGKPLQGYASALADVRAHGGMPSDSSLAAARTAGVDVDTVLASNTAPAAHRSNPFARLLGLARADDGKVDDGADEDADAEPIRPLLVSDVERTADTQPATGIKSRVARAMAKLKLVHIQKLLPSATAARAKPAPSPAADAPAVSTALDAAPAQIQPIEAAAAVTPTQIILARGYWEGPPDGMAVANPLAEISYRRSEAIADTTGSIPDDGAGEHRTGGAALAYAEPQGSDAASGAPSGIAALRAAALAALATHAAPAAETTIAVKRAADQAVSTVVSAGTASIAVIKGSMHLANPWLRAIVLSPSVNRFLTTLALGDRDFRWLASLMTKPTHAVLMKFAADPNPGLAPDRFSGAAVVFVSTVNYAPATHTAALR